MERGAGVDRKPKNGARVPYHPDPLICALQRPGFCVGGRLYLFEVFPNGTRVWTRPDGDGFMLGPHGKYPIREGWADL